MLILNVNAKSEGKTTFVNFKLGGRGEGKYLLLIVVIFFFSKAFSKEKGEWNTKDSGLGENSLYFENSWKLSEEDSKRQA